MASMGDSILQLLQSTHSEDALVDIVWYDSSSVDPESAEGISLFGALRIASKIAGASVRLASHVPLAKRHASSHHLAPHSDAKSRGANSHDQHKQQLTREW
eukprot:1361489-Rhodomonas_salina.3